VSRGDASAVPALTVMAGGHENANARIHALWTLDGLGALPPDLVRQNLASAHARVRRAAVQLAEPRWLAGDETLGAAIANLATDTDPAVATQVFLALRVARNAGRGPVSFTAFDDPARPLPVVAKLRERDAQEATQKISETAKHGKLVYEGLCIACHGVDGEGVAAGDKRLAPPLAKSAWFADGGHLPVLARVLLKGQTGPIAGVTYGEGLMPPLEKSHTDAQIAEVLTFVGERWHGWKQPADPAVIARVRAEVESRQGPWTHEELEKVAR
jgi:mono/diheme cytochrome c family protein